MECSVHWLGGWKRETVIHPSAYKVVISHETVQQVCLYVNIHQSGTEIKFRLTNSHLSSMPDFQQTAPSSLTHTGGPSLGSPVF